MVSAKNSSAFVSKKELGDRIIKDTTAALEIYGLPNSSYRATRNKHEVSNQATLFYNLIPHILQWLGNTALLGQYAITGERYRAVFLRVSSYILRLPQPLLMAILSYDSPRIYLRNSMYVAWRTFHHSMEHLPLTMELYFFVIMKHDRNDHDQGLFYLGSIGRSVRRYLLLVSILQGIHCYDTLLTAAVSPVSVNRCARNSHSCPIQHPRST